jgi:trimeric autotransporter adhesin
MSSLNVTPDILAAASGDLQTFDSALRSAAAAAQTTAITAPAADEVSTAISAEFGTYAQEFQARSAQAAGFHDVDQLGGEAMGVITRVAGTGIRGTGLGGDDGLATEAELNTLFYVAVTADRGFLIADSYSFVVRKVSSAGVIIRVAGTGTSGTSGDNGLATEAELFHPTGLAVTADGGFLITDGTVVRKVSSAGVITRVAGTGTAGNSGDDGPATDAQLNGPSGVAATADGGFLVTEPTSHLVRKVSSAGVITRVAGTGTAGNSGDDGPATDAELNGPWGVAVTADKGFLIANYFSHVVRKVSSTGVITRVAGTGTAGNSGDDGPATDAEISGPWGLAVTADGGFLIADQDSYVVRKVASA